MVMVSIGRLKKDGKTKYVKLLGKGILTLVDHLFWNLPFCSVKQSHAVRKKAGVSEEEWSTKWEEIVAEHDIPVLVSSWPVDGKSIWICEPGGLPVVLAL